MAKKGDVDPTKYKDNDPSKKLLSKINADRKYNQSLYKLNLRLPKEYKEHIAAYVAGYNSGNPDKPIESLNTWIKSLIDEKLGI